MNGGPNLNAQAQCVFVGEKEMIIVVFESLPTRDVNAQHKRLRAARSTIEKSAHH